MGHFGCTFSANNLIGAMTEGIATAPTPHSEIYVLQLGGAIGDVAEEARPYMGRGASHYWIVETIPVKLSLQQHPSR